MTVNSSRSLSDQMEASSIKCSLMLWYSDVLVSLVKKRREEDKNDDDERVVVLLFNTAACLTEAVKGRAVVANKERRIIFYFLDRFFCLG